MLRTLVRAVRDYIRESRERNTVYYPIASDGYIGECHWCGQSVYEGGERAIVRNGELRFFHWDCRDLPIILGL